MLGWALRSSKIAPLSPKAYATVRSWWCLIGFQRMSMMCSNDLKACATVGSRGCSRLLFWRSWSVLACAVLSGIHRFKIFIAMEGSKEQGREGKSISLYILPPPDRPHLMRQLVIPWNHLAKRNQRILPVQGHSPDILIIVAVLCPGTHESRLPSSDPPSSAGRRAVAAR